MDQIILFQFEMVPLKGGKGDSHASMPLQGRLSRLCGCVEGISTKSIKMPTEEATAKCRQHNQFILLLRTLSNLPPIPRCSALQALFSPQSSSNGSNRFSIYNAHSIAPHCSDAVYSVFSIICNLPHRPPRAFPCSRH